MTIVVTIAALIILLYVNILISRRTIANKDVADEIKNTWHMIIWTFPFLVAWLVKGFNEAAKKYVQAACNPPNESTTLGLAPTIIKAMSEKEFDVIAHLATSNGLPILDWQALHKWVTTLEKEEFFTVIDQGRKAWLLHLRDASNIYTHLHESKYVYILSSLNFRVVQVMAEYVSATRNRINKLLQNIVNFSELDKSIFLIFDSENDYYRYVSVYYPEEGVFATSGGMFINAGCPHIVLVCAELSDIEPVIVHEMTHLALSHLQLPKWLDEGLAVNMEHQLTRQPIYNNLREIREKHEKFWNRQTIQEFWSGQSFGRPDDGNLLSYELARIIVEQMAKKHDRFADFVTAATYQDGGALAAKNMFAIDLGELAATLLEKTNFAGWAPDPVSWARSETQPA